MLLSFPVVFVFVTLFVHGFPSGSLAYPSSLPVYTESNAPQVSPETYPSQAYPETNPSEVYPQSNPSQDYSETYSSQVYSNQDPSISLPAQVDVTHITHIIHVEPQDIIAPPTEVVNVHHHHHHVVPISVTPIIQKIHLPKIEIPKLNLPRLKNFSFNLKKTVEVQKRALFDEALAFKIGLGLGTVGGAATGAAAGTATGVVGTHILHKAKLLTIKKVFGKHKFPVPLPIPIPFHKHVPIPLPLPLPVPIVIPKLVSLGLSKAYDHHGRGDVSESDEEPVRRKQEKIKIGGKYQHDLSNPEDKYDQTVQRDDDRRDVKESVQDEEEEETTTPKPKKRRRKVKKTRKTTKKPTKGGFEITLG